MLVSSDTLLNILLPNNNKVLKDVLKEADFKSLEQMINNNSTSVSDVLTELFDSVKNGTKSNNTIENILKNSSIFKDLGSVSSNISTLLENISQDENLSKFKPLIENFLKDIKNMDENSLKEQIKNSGVFLESKLSSSTETKIQTTLTQVQNLLKDINIPQSKQVSETINQLLKAGIKETTNFKEIVSSLKELSNSLTPSQLKELSKFTNELQNLISKGTLRESEFENNPNLENQNSKSILNTQTKELLNQIKNEIVKNPLLEKSIMPLLEKLIKNENLFVKNENIQNLFQTNNLNSFSSNFSSNLSPLLTTLKESMQYLNQNSSSVQNLNELISKVENLIQEHQTNLKHESKISHDMKSILLQLQDELSSKNDSKSLELSKQVDKLLTQIDYCQLNSLVTNSNYVYVPFFWDMLEDGTISMKKADEDKFYCQINLNLKEFGKVDLMLALYDKNKLDLTIYAQKDEFKAAIKENIQKLKISLNNVKLIPVNIKLLDLKDEKENKQEQIYTNSSYDLSTNYSSLNIRV